LKLCLTVRDIKNGRGDEQKILRPKKTTTYQNGPETPYFHATLELCKSVAAHVHELMMADAVRPVRMVRPAVLKWKKKREKHDVNMYKLEWMYETKEIWASRCVAINKPYLKCSLVTWAPRKCLFK
jgi:hypothetical protein